MTRTIHLDRLPAGPFVSWINDELAGIEDQARAQQMLAFRLDVNERSVYRWKNSLGSEGEPVGSYARSVIENVLDRCDTRGFADLYPEVAAADDVALEDDAYCSSCHDVVTPIRGMCPWCDRPVLADIPVRLYCKREKAPRFPALDGHCWRCGGELRPQPPDKPCECGCGERIPGFNMRSGRPNRFIPGHQPRGWDSSKTVPAEPFALWLEQQLRDLDPIQSLARRVKLSRDELLDILNRRVDVIERRVVRRSLFSAAIEGQGHAQGQRPGATRIAELYAANPCPRCGREKKNPKAEFCRPCRIEVGPTNPNRTTSMTEPLLLEARALYDSGLTYNEVAERIQGRTRRSSVPGIRVQLINEFKARGWSHGRRSASQLRNAA